MHAKHKQENLQKAKNMRKAVEVKACFVLVLQQLRHPLNLSLALAWAQALVGGGVAVLKARQVRYGH
jgi:hypothetical protein